MAWMSRWRLANVRTEGVRTVNDDVRRQARLSRRNLLKGLAMSASAGVLLACGGGGTSGSAATTPAAGSGAATAPAVQTTGTASTVVWFAARDTTGYTPKQVEAFNTANKNIQIDYQEQGATTQDLHDKFVTVAGAKDASVDIVSMDVPYVPEFAAAGWTIAVDEILPKDEQAKFFQGTLNGATYQGKLGGVPWYNNGPGLYYRKDLLTAKGLTPPKTYDELLNVARTLQTAEMAGFAMQLPQSEGGIINWMIGAVRRAEDIAWDSDELRSHARKFDSAVFRDQLRHF